MQAVSRVGARARAGGRPRPLRRACRRLSLRRIAPTWWSMVLDDTNSRSAICLLRSPCSTSASTSTSRGVRFAGFSRVVRRRPRRSAPAPHGHAGDGPRWRPPARRPDRAAGSARGAGRRRRRRPAPAPPRTDARSPPIGPRPPPTRRRAAARRGRPRRRGSRRPARRAGARGRARRRRPTAWERDRQLEARPRSPATTPSRSPRSQAASAPGGGDGLDALQLRSESSARARAPSSAVGRARIAAAGAHAGPA